MKINLKERNQYFLHKMVKLQLCSYFNINKKNSGTASGEV